MLPIPYAILTIENESDREFMEHIFVSYHYLMYHEIYQIVGDSWLAEDILQTVIVNLIDHIETLRTLSTKKLINYIISASKNTALTQIHKESRRQESSYDDWLDIPQDTASEGNPEFWTLQNEKWDCLAVIWSELDERSKYLLSGRYILNKSYEEMGKELGIKPESVRMAVTRAKRAAYALMKARYPDN